MPLDRRALLDYVAKGGVVVLACLAILPILSILGEILVKGGKVVLEAGVKFFTETPPPPGERIYGILTALAGTLELCILSVAMGIPISFATALLAVEFSTSVLSRLVRTLSRTLLEFPTVIVGMFVYVVVVEPMGAPSIVAGAVALSLVMLPYVVSYVESALKGVPQAYREAGFSLGMTRAQIAFRVVVPVARRGIATGFLLGLAKALGETAPLLFTLGRARKVLNLNPLLPGDAIPMLIYDYAIAPYPNMREVAWGAALVLVTILLTLQVLARTLAKEVKV